MQAIHLYSQVGSDGILRLEVPVTATNSELDVLVIVQPRSAAQSNPLPPTEWLPGFFEKTAGQWQGEPLVRPDQGAYEDRRDLR